MDNPFDRDGKRRFNIPMTILMAFGGLLIAAVLALGFGLVVMLLWNWLMPTIFHLPTIDYWQGWGLVLLSHILVKSGQGPGGRHGWRWGHGPGRGRGHGPWNRDHDHGPGHEPKPADTGLV